MDRKREERRRAGGPTTHGEGERGIRSLGVCVCVCAYARAIVHVNLRGPMGSARRTVAFGAGFHG